MLQSSVCLHACLFFPFGVVFVLCFILLLKKPDNLCIWVLDLIFRDSDPYSELMLCSCWFLWFTGITSCMCYCPTPTLHLNLALIGDGAFLFSLKKTHSVWFISVLNYGDTENVLINHLLLVIPMLYPCHYTNLCPHKPHKHAPPHTHTHTHTHLSRGIEDVESAVYSPPPPPPTIPAGRLELTTFGLWVRLCNH